MTRRHQHVQQRTPRSLIAVLTALTLALLAGVTGASEAPAHAATSYDRVSATPSDPVTGELVRLSGTLSSTNSRPVQLQEQDPNGVWHVIKTATSTAGGGFTFTVRYDGAVRYFQVHAPATTGQTAITTQGVTLTPSHQSRSFTLGTTGVEIGDAVTALGTFAPPRPGRTVTLQRLSGGSWTTIASGAVDGLGHLRLPVPTSETGLWQYRMVASAWNGAPAIATYRQYLSVTTAPTSGPALALVTQLPPGLSYADARQPTMTDDGRYVGFLSWDRWAPSDPNACIPTEAAGRCGDVFLWDRTTGAISVIPTRKQLVADDRSATDAVLSGDGRWLAFSSRSPHVIPGKNPDGQDVLYLRNLATGVVRQVSRAADGGAPNNGSDGVSVSRDGRFVVWSSLADNLVPHDDNGDMDVFLWDRLTGSTTLVSRSTTGGSGNGQSVEATISGDGRFVAFTSYTTNLVADDHAYGAQHVYVWERTTASIERIDTPGRPEDAGAASPALSRTGRYLVYTQDAAPDLAYADRGADVIRMDRTNRTWRTVTRGPYGAVQGGSSVLPALSGDGRFVSFASTAPNLVAGRDTGGDWDGFVWDATTGVVAPLSRMRSGAESVRGLEDQFPPDEGPSLIPLSYDGRYAALQAGSPLTADDTNDDCCFDIFLWDRLG